VVETFANTSENRPVKEPQSSNDFDGEVNQKMIEAVCMNKLNINKKHFQFQKKSVDRMSVICSHIQT